MLPIYTIDLETDPFQEGRFPAPFAAGFYDGVNYAGFWGADCLERLHTHLRIQEPGIVYAHNGGRFDFMYCMEWFAGHSMRIVNSRIIKARMRCAAGWHELRDSYAIMPFSLGSYKGGKKQKQEIEMWKLEAENREKYKREIQRYLRYDCETLHELVSAFCEKFGPQLTIGTTAMKELSKLHCFAHLNSEQDQAIRSLYYYGGRVECFERGIVETRLKVYDVNSMYPYVMKSAKHPMGKPGLDTKKVGRNTCFITCRGKNHGAFPVREKHGGIRFDVEQGIFHVTRHEWDAALDTGLFEPEAVLRCVNFEERGTFEEFVDKFYNLKKHAKEIDDAINEIFYKYILNSGYGKFSQNPENYEECIICHAGREHGPQPQCICDTEVCTCGGWDIKSISTLHPEAERNFWIWSKPSPDVSRFNVATGASITGAARAVLMRGIAMAQRPVYCDTDSIICEELPGITASNTELGSWKLEAEGSHLAIGGKKLYALLEKDGRLVEVARSEAAKKGKKLEDAFGGVAIKKANKGVVVTAAEIVDVALGGTVVSKRAAPSFKADGSYRFIQRRVRATV